MKKSIGFIVFLLIACSSKDAFQQEFPIPISDYYFTTSGNLKTFKMDLKQPISDDIELKYLYFRNQKASLKIISKDKFEAVFTKPDLILDADSKEESVNQSPIFENTRFHLKPNEAVLEYQLKRKTKHYHFTNVVEKSNR